VSGFLDATKATEVLRAIGLFMTQSFAEPAHNVSERGIRHWWFREELFIRSGYGGGEVVIFDNLFFEFKVLEGVDWRWQGEVGRGRGVRSYGAIFFFLKVWNG